MPTLAENTTFIELKAAKPTGLSLTQLGVPQLDCTVVKKGKLHELNQMLEDGRVGRRFQNVRVTGVKTREGEVETAKIFIQFEVFGDDNVPQADNSGFAAALMAGTESLTPLPPTVAFLPYARAWFENQFVFDVPTAVFDCAERIELTLKADKVRML
ncbi:hypothetical protein [Azoarcus sp. L1K30]|uniref:hypothetical protein n=1 Tax=Azoarcus sp. L1K30 TaxID=2820277 RepID=UPI0032C21B5F